MYDEEFLVLIILFVLQGEEKAISFWRALLIPVSIPLYPVNVFTVPYTYKVTTD